MQNITKEGSYVINPDVVLREEDGDGALLFNPDTNDVKVINSTGLFIWKFCRKQKTTNEIINALKDSFEQVPETEVIKDAEQFISQLVNSGFLGKVDS
jgi:hypothetical protein